MRAVVCRAHGPIDDLAVDEIAAPESRTGTARLDVPAAAADHADNLVIGGHHRVSTPPPFVPRSDFVGRASGKLVIVR